jgi:hypothetical protein
MRLRSMEQQHIADVPDSSITVSVQTVAVLVSTDEPEPWLLQQQQQHLSPRRSGSSFSSPERGAAAGPSTSSVQSPVQQQQPFRLSPPAGYAPFSTCSTPLMEVALTPLRVRLQLLKPCGARQGAAGQAVVQVEVDARVRAGVYSVDKLGWEPVLDPWALKVSVLAVIEGYEPPACPLETDLSRLCSQSSFSRCAGQFP